MYVLGKIFLSVFIVFSLLGCEPYSPGYDERTTKLILVNGFYIDNNQSIHIRYNKNTKPYIHQYSKLDANASIWEHLSNDNFKINDIQANFRNNYVEVIQKDNILFEKYLPTIDDIAISTNIELSSNKIVYTTYRDKINFGWDMKTYIASIYSKDKKSIYHFSIEDKGSYYNIYLIDSSPSYTQNILYYNNKYNFIRKRDIEDFDYGKFTTFSISTNEKAMFCYEAAYQDIRCFIRDRNNKIISQKLFGEIYPREYKNIYYSIALRQDGGVTALGSLIFDNNDNMHIFYNNLDNVTGNYFMYRMYKKDNPTTPLYEQKIPWK
ncbi:MAG: hypothetical protein FAF05_02490 [Epsilonproteobacteria bacterium]|nr:hypothetical protein [Campylobacterota bacterium]